MNKAKLKSYAPQARKDFIAAVEARANLLGLSEKSGHLDIAPSEKKGDVALIGGQAWPVKVHDQRERLIKRIKKEGYAQTIEAVAYTWFNRFAALRYMEIHDYLGHGYRALSSREGGLPEILTHATDVTGALPGLNAAQVAEMKLAGNKDGELYRQLLVAQCNALSSAMPFLFERIDDESELLLPGNLERTDSVVAKLVGSIDEEDWSEVEVIGWLYQFYISEKKDEVIGKVVKSEDIPAATQLFTPNWIVQYLVQNSVGRLWLMANPTSSLKSQWPYYIEQAEQTPEVQAQLDALIQTRMAEDGGSLNPESITVLDPACGSGHILVEAYEALKAIYLERGYQARAIPRLILEKNLYGLDIDDRAAQLAGFALMMKARADDRRLLDSPIKLNVLSLQESKGLDIEEFAGHLKPYGISRNALGQLIDTFAHAKTFGSLIQIPEALDGELSAIASGLEKANQSGDVFARAAAQDLVPLVGQAAILAMKFDAVVANPPYMGGKGMAPILRGFALKYYERGKSDLFSMFIERGLLFCNRAGFTGMVTMQSWMFLSSYESLRAWFIENASMDSLVQIGYNSFPELNSKVAQACAFVASRTRLFAKGIYFDLNDAPQSSDKNQVFLGKRKSGLFKIVELLSFNAIPGAPFAHWVSEKTRAIFRESERLGDVSKPRQGLASGDNERFLRLWYEVDRSKTGFDFDDYMVAKGSGYKWFPHNKGGEFRKWYGNLDHVIAFDEENFQALSEMGNHLPSRQLYFKEGMSWTALTSGNFNGRYTDHAIFDAKGPVLFANKIDDLFYLIAFCNSAVATSFLKILAPTLDFNQGPVGNLPIKFPSNPEIRSKISTNANNCIELAITDWNSRETSWGFKSLWVSRASDITLLSQSWQANSTLLINRMASIKWMEEENNKLFISLYNLESEVVSDVTEGQVTVELPSREKDVQRLISYIIGCMMGRYSLDEPGLIYAHAGNVGFDATRYKTFPADADGIVPITDELWFEDDATNRIREFLRVVWGAETLDENMAWLAESLGKKASETPEEAIRRYVSVSFFKDHLQTYKKRPIYWLFSSGKQGAFQALVYLHRYHEGTLARMRAEYVVPLTGKMQSRIEMLEKDKDAAGSTAARNKIAKQIESLKKKHVELLAYDEKLRHYADMRISLDLDDGVKVNYGKFGDLLAEVKSVTGGSNED